MNALIERKEVKIAADFSTASRFAWKDTLHVGCQAPPGKVRPEARLLCTVPDRDSRARPELVPHAVAILESIVRCEAKTYPMLSHGALAKMSENMRNGT